MLANTGGGLYAAPSITHPCKDRRIWMSQGSYTLECSFKCVNHVLQTLRSLERISSWATASFFQEGIKFTARGPANACEAHVFLAKELFSSYNVSLAQDCDREDNLLHHTLSDAAAESIEINITTLTSCLQIVGSARNDSYKQIEKQSRRMRTDPSYIPDDPIVSATCSWLYEGEGSPFVLYFSEGKHTVTRCNLKSRVPTGDNMYLPLNLDEISQKIIMVGSALDDALTEFEALGPEAVIIRSSTQDNSFAMLADENEGAEMGLEYVFSHDPSIITSHSVKDYSGKARSGCTVIAYKYNFDSLKCVRDAVKLATDVSLRCDSAGFMSIQCKCKAGADSETHIDFRIRPYEDDYDDYDSNSDAGSYNENGMDVGQDGYTDAATEDESQSLFISGEE